MDCLHEVNVKNVPWRHKNKLNNLTRIWHPLVQRFRQTICSYFFTGLQFALDIFWLSFSLLLAEEGTVHRSLCDSHRCWLLHQVAGWNSLGQHFPNARARCDSSSGEALTSIYKNQCPAIMMLLIKSNWSFNNLTDACKYMPLSWITN